MIDEQRELFDVDRTTTKSCPVHGCASIRFPGQDRVITCAHDLDPERRRRPRGCLNQIDPATAPFPDGY